MSIFLGNVASVGKGFVNSVYGWAFPSSNNKDIIDLIKAAKDALVTGIPPEQAFGRAKEKSQMISLLMNKQHIFLEGPPGVGKTNIVHDLAWHIAKGDLPTLQGRNIHIWTMKTVQNFSDLVKNPMHGGIQSILEPVCIEVAKYRNEHEHYLFLDEMYGVLMNDLLATVKACEEKNIRVICASLNQPSLEKSFGYNRRTPSQVLKENGVTLISLDSMNASQTAEVLKDYFVTLKMEVEEKYPGLTLTIEDSVITAVISYGAKKQPEKNEPYRSIRCLREFIYCSVNGPLSKQPQGVSLNANDFLTYCTQVYIF